MEAVRRIDELPEIEAVLDTPTPPFMRAPDKTELPFEGIIAEKFGEREHAIFDALDQGGTVEQLVGRTCQSSFDVKKGLALLSKTGFACPVKTGGTPGASLSDIGVIRTGLIGRRRREFRVLFQAAFTLLLE